MGENGDKVAPDSIVVANNLVLNFKKAVQITKGTNLVWQGNATFGTADKALFSGMRSVDPRLVKVDGLYRLSPLSPAIGAGVGTYEHTALDVDGQARPASSASVGADEYVDGGVNRKPLLVTEVGPAAL